MSVEAISSVTAASKKLATAYDPNQKREREVLRDSLQRSFPEMATDQLDESIAIAFKFAGVHSDRTEIIGLARIYLARRLEMQAGAEPRPMLG